MTDTDQKTPTPIDAAAIRYAMQEQEIATSPAIGSEFRFFDGDGAEIFCLKALVFDEGRIGFAKLFRDVLLQSWMEPSTNE